MLESACIRGTRGRVDAVSPAPSVKLSKRAPDDVPQPQSRDRPLRPPPAEARSRIRRSRPCLFLGAVALAHTTRHDHVRSRAGRVPGRGTVRSQPCTRQPHDDHARIRTGLPADGADMPDARRAQ